MTGVTEPTKRTQNNFGRHIRYMFKPFRKTKVHLKPTLYKLFKLYKVTVDFRQIS